MGYTDSVSLLSKKHNLNIVFQHVLSGKIVSFPAFLTEFSDRWTSEWEPQSVYGRMDDIQTFKKTSRSITIGWDVVAASESEARKNLSKCSKLISMLYPTYSGDSASSISGSPLFKLKFANLVSDPELPSWAAGVTEAGLVGTINGFDYKPELDPSFFISKEKGLFAKTVNLNCTFTVLHTKPVGWTRGSFRQVKYPYGVGGHGKKIPIPRETEIPTGETEERDDLFGDTEERDDLFGDTEERQGVFGTTTSGVVGTGGIVGASPVPSPRSGINIRDAESRAEAEAEAEASRSDLEKSLDKIALASSLGS